LFSPAGDHKNQHGFQKKETVFRNEKSIQESAKILRTKESDAKAKDDCVQEFSEFRARFAQEGDSVPQIL